MNPRRRLPALLAALLLAAAPPASATEHGIFVDGSYSDDEEDTAMDELVDRRLDGARQVFDGRHPQGSSRRVGSKEELREALDGIHCGCGDSITLVMMGHGDDDRFVFSKARRSRDRRLRADDLAEWLEDAAVECCCEIHVVIFSCHSGSFLDELFEQPHVASVWASCGEDELSYSDAHWLDEREGEDEDDGGPTLVDEGDWMEGFVADWRQAPRGASVGEALQESSESAEEKMPERFTPVQHPEGWRRGEGEVVAHVESRTRRHLRVHVFEPEFLRSTTRRVDVSEVEQPEERLRRCDWVRFPARFGAPGEVTVTGDVARTEAPRQRTLAHFVGMRGRDAIFHTVRPKWQYCRNQVLTLGDPSHLNREELPVCSWIDQELEIVDPEERLRTTTALTRANPTFRVKVRVSGTRNHERGTVRVHLLEPPWLRCDDVEVRLPGGRETLDSLPRGSILVLDLAMRPVDRHGTLEGRNLRRVHETVEWWRPEPEDGAPAGEAPRDEESPEPFEGLDLGTLAPGRYDLPVTARNVDCPGRHDFQVSFVEREGTAGATPWLQLPDDRVLRNIRPGGSKVLTTVVHVGGAPPGRHLAGTLRIECLTCPPTCHQDVTEIAVRATVGSGVETEPR